MSDDQSSRSQGSKSWLERISQAFSSGPESVEDVLEILRDAESQSIIDTDSMSIIEGAMQVIDMRVDEIMIPRSQMITVKASQEPKEFLPEIISSAHSRFPVIDESPDDVLGVLLAKDLLDRKSTRLNSSHVRISYAVFCLKKKKNNTNI